MRRATAEAAQGRWDRILREVAGLGDVALSGKHGPCPICGGSDRFRFDNKEGRGTFFCNNCGPGDGIALVQKVRNVDFASAAKMVDQYLGNTPNVEPVFSKQTRTPVNKRKALNSVWRSAKDRSVAIKYLESRDIPSRLCEMVSPDIRGHDSLLYYPGPGTKGTPMRAMVALVRNYKGEPLTIHRTYLMEDGKREKKLMSPPSTMQGPHVRVVEGDGDSLIIGEGIETALAGYVAVRGLFPDVKRATVYAALSAVWMPQINFSVYQRIFVMADHDRNFTGQAAAFATAKAACSRKNVNVTVLMPETEGHDICDAWRNGEIRVFNGGSI